MVLFAFFGLLSTTLLAGGAAVGVPVIIHLLNRRRYKIVTWAAMRFLLNAQKQNTRRMRVEQLLLLLVRMSLVALIVLAMAAVMPWLEPVWAYVPNWGGWFGDPVTVRDQRVHHLIVLDASLSMNLKDGDKTLFERARKLAMQRIESSQAGDGFSVLMLKDNPSWLVGKPAQDRGKVRQELETVRAGHGNASVPAALNMIVSKLSEASSRFPAQVVYFLTDLQKSSWQSALATGTADENKKRDPAEEIQQGAPASSSWTSARMTPSISPSPICRSPSRSSPPAATSRSTPPCRTSAPRSEKTCASSCWSARHARTPASRP